MPDNTPQIASVTSESLQATVRRLLPSQQGFGHDLQASNVIIPTIDLTPTAEGSLLRTDLQTAWDFSTVNARVFNSTSTLITSAGFWKLQINVSSTGDAAGEGIVAITDGLTSKTIVQTPNISVVDNERGNFNITTAVYLRSGDSLTVQSSGTGCIIVVTARNIADINGNLTDPLGYVSQ